MPAENLQFLNKNEFERVEGKFRGDERFSIVVPTWNNLPFLRLFVESLRKNSSYPHQIILHINDGSDGTVEWAKAEHLAFSRSPGNVGVCFGVNAARPLVRTPYIFYFNDDMYVLPGWDAAMVEEIEKIGHAAFYLSATMIEPYPTRSKPVVGGKNYGTSIETFEEERLLREYEGLRKADWSGATRPPSVMHRDLWDLVGGFSTDFSPGMYSDPDLSMKLWQAGVREVRGVGRSLVYHFVSKSVGRVVPNHGHRHFIRKWGITCSDFYRLFLRKGEPYTGPCVPPPEAKLRRAVFKAGVQMRFSR